MSDVNGSEIERVSALLRGSAERLAGADAADQEGGEDQQRVDNGDGERAVSANGSEPALEDTDAALAGSDETAAAVDSEGDAAGDESGDAPVTIKDIAEKLGVDAADVYEGLEIPLGDGERVTLGEWKDRVKALRDIDGQRTEVETARQQYEKDLARTRAELSQIVRLIPPDMQHNLVEQARTNQAQYEKEQWEAVVAAIPKWKESPESFAADRAAIVKIGSEYGFSEPEMTYTQDARTVRLLHDFVRLRERFEQQNAAGKQTAAQIKRSAKGKARGSNRRLADAIRGAKESKDPRTKEAMVSQLIRAQ